LAVRWTCGLAGATLADEGVLLVVAGLRGAVVGRVGGAVGAAGFAGSVVLVTVSATRFTGAAAAGVGAG
jgi:hypothetical protein